MFWIPCRIQRQALAGFRGVLGSPATSHLGLHGLVWLGVDVFFTDLAFCRPSVLPVSSFWIKFSGFVLDGWMIKVSPNTWWLATPIPPPYHKQHSRMLNGVNEVVVQVRVAWTIPACSGMKRR